MFAAAAYVDDVLIRYNEAGHSVELTEAGRRFGMALVDAKEFGFAGLPPALAKANAYGVQAHSGSYKGVNVTIIIPAVDKAPVPIPLPLYTSYRAVTTRAL